MNTRHLWLRLVAAGGLAVDAYVHWNLAPDFDSFVGAGPAHVSQGQLFRVEAVLAVIALLLVLFVDHLLAAVLAFVTAAAAWRRFCCTGTSTSGPLVRCRTCTTPPGTPKRPSV